MKTKSETLAYLEKINNKFDSLAEEIRQFPEEAQNHHPQPDRWSPAQALFHLQQIEQFMLSYARKKTQAPVSEFESITQNTEDRSEVLDTVLRIPQKKMTAPSGTMDNWNEQPMREVLQNFIRTRKEWTSFLEDLPAEYFSKEVVKHPRAGRLGIFHTLSFFDTHLDHHIPQLEEGLGQRLKISHE